MGEPSAGGHNPSPSLDPSLEPGMRPAPPRSAPDYLGSSTFISHDVFSSVSPCQTRSCFRLVALSKGRFSSIGHLDPLRVRRGLGVVVVVPVPPLVWRALGVSFWRVLPSLLTAERRDIEVAPGGPHRLVAAVVDEVCAKYLVAVADECIVAVPLVHAEV